MFLIVGCGIRCDQSDVMEKCGVMRCGAMLINDVANIWHYLNVAWSTWNVWRCGTSVM